MSSERRCCLGENVMMLGVKLMCFNLSFCHRGAVLLNLEYDLQQLCVA